MCVAGPTITMSMFISSANRIKCVHAGYMASMYGEWNVLQFDHFGFAWAYVARCVRACALCEHTIGVQTDGMGLESNVGLYRLHKCVR